MKIQNHKKTKKVTPIIIVIFLVLLIGVVAALFYLNQTRSNSLPNDTDQATKNVHVSDNKQSQQLKDDPDGKLVTPNTDNPSTPASNENTGKKQVQMTASSNIVDNMVYIRGGINYPLNVGSCYAQLTGPSGQSIRKDTTLLPGPASTDCKTISIPIAELASGKWTFTLHYVSDTYEGISNEISFSI